MIHWREETAATRWNWKVNSMHTQVQQADDSEPALLSSAVPARKKRSQWVIRILLLIVMVSAVWIYESRSRSTATTYLELYLTTTRSQAGLAYDAIIGPYGRYLRGSLHEVLRSESSDERQKVHAAYALARFDDLADDDLRFLLQMIPAAQPEDWGSFFRPALNALSNKSRLHSLLRELATQEPHSGSYRYALTALGTGDASLLAEAAAFDADLTDRTDLIHQWFTWGAGFYEAIQIMQDETADEDTRSAICCIFGSAGKGSYWSEYKEEIMPTLLDEYRGATVPRHRFIAEWALRQWNALPEDHAESATDFWETNSQSMTLVWIPEGSFQMGVDDDSNESPRHEVQIEKGFWMSNREVSVEQFERFINDGDYSGPGPLDWRGYHAYSSPQPACPIQDVTWWNAVRYCNWLSRQEGLPVAYDEQSWEPIPDSSGYRLPSEDEWEYACRAGGTTDFSFGSNGQDHLRHYAVAGGAESVPGGKCIPNSWGLFDMHGNVWEWCEDAFRDSYAADADVDEDSRVVRGGSFDYSEAQYHRCSDRYSYAPDFRNFNIGFRVTRTP